MKALLEWNLASDLLLKARSVMAFDMDDTLTHKGSLPSEVLEKLESLQNSKNLSVMVTGRPAGWADAIVKLLPFDAVVAENGAVLFWWPKGKAARKTGEEPRRLFWTPQGYSTLRPDDLQERLDPICLEVLQEFPRTRVASDQPYRIYDLAIDFAEEVVPALSIEDAKKIQKVFEKHGAVAKISSIHVNGWFGNFSKVDGLSRVLQEFNLNLKEHVVYVGDSPNDAPLFEAAGVSIGVANIASFIGKVDFSKPQYVTQAEAAVGSIQAINHFLSEKQK